MLDLVENIKNSKYVLQNSNKTRKDVIAINQNKKDESPHRV